MNNEFGITLKSKKLKTQGHVMMATLLLTMVSIALLVTACGSKREQDLTEEQNRISANPPPSKATFEIPSNTGNSSIKNSDPCVADLDQRTIIKPGESTIDASFTGNTDVKGCSVNGKHPILYINAEMASFFPPPALDCQPKQGGEFNIRCLSPGSFIGANGSVNVVIRGNAEYQSSKVHMRMTYEK